MNAPYDDFVVTVVDAQADPPANAFPATQTSGPALNAAVLSSDDDGDPATLTDTAPVPVVWTIAGTYGTAYRIVALSSDEAVATTASAGGVITITPKAQGTTTIGPVYMVHHLWQTNPADAPTDHRVEIAPARTFTVHYSADAPLVSIFQDTNDNNAADAGEPTGGDDDPIGFDVTTETVGKIGELKSHCRR